MRRRDESTQGDSRVVSSQRRGREGREGQGVFVTRRNSLLETHPSPSESHSRNKSITLSEFDMSASRSCWCTGLLASMKSPAPNLVAFPLPLSLPLTCSCLSNSPIETKPWPTTSHESKRESTTGLSTYEAGKEGDIGEVGESEEFSADK